MHRHIQVGLTRFKTFRCIETGQQNKADEQIACYIYNSSIKSKRDRNTNRYEGKYKPDKGPFTKGKQEREGTEKLLQRSGAAEAGLRKQKQTEKSSTAAKTSHTQNGTVQQIMQVAANTQAWQFAIVPL